MGAFIAGESKLREWLKPELEALYEDYGQVPNKKDAKRLTNRIIEISIKERCLVVDIRNAFDEMRANYNFYKTICLASYYTAYKKKK